MSRNVFSEISPVDISTYQIGKNEMKSNFVFFLKLASQFVELGSDRSIFENTFIFGVCYNLGRLLLSRT